MKDSRKDQLQRLVESAIKRGKDEKTTVNSIVAKYHYRKRVVRDYYRGLQLFVDVEA